MTLEFTAGLLLRRQIRHALERFKFQGHEFEILESKGILASDFIVKGDPSVIIPIGKWLEGISKYEQ